MIRAALRSIRATWAAGTGDPNPRSLWPCMASPGGMFAGCLCTLPAGHDGPHDAQGTDYQSIVRWERETE